jgi:hypothetical protein
MGKIIDTTFGAYLHLRDRSKRLDLMNCNGSEINNSWQELVELLKNTEYYHGTGAYHYEFEGTKYYGTPKGTRYSLESLLSDGLVPQRDFFNEVFKTGAEKTTSLSKNRVYARCYADLFMEEGTELAYCYGPPQFWGVLVAAKMAACQMSTDVKNQRKLRIEGKKQEIDYEQRREAYRNNHCMLSGWTRSFRKDGKYEMKNFLFALGAKSDIPGNFGIIIGVKKGIVSPLPIKYTGVALYEDRTTRHIHPNEYSLIQVPLKKADFVRRELDRLGADIPIFPIEFVELINHELGFSAVSKSHRELENEPKSS